MYTVYTDLCILYMHTHTNVILSMIYSYLKEYRHIESSNKSC